MWNKLTTINTTPATRWMMARVRSWTNTKVESHESGYFSAKPVTTSVKKLSSRRRC